jgi:RNA polymerase sigma-70 factor, ECF subfamily
MPFGRRSVRAALSLLRKASQALFVIEVGPGIGSLGSGRPMDSQTDHLEDQELVRAVLGGDHRAIELLVQRLRCIPRILAMLNQRMSGNLGPEDLNDLTQDMLALLWPRLKGYTGQAALESWFYGFCLNGYMNAVRKGWRRQAQDLLEEQSIAGPPAPASALEYDELHRGLERLEERETRVIRLKYFDELTFDEIGTRLGISPNTVKTCFYRGMRRLEELLRQGSEEA